MTIRITINAPDDLAEAIERQASKQNRPVAQVATMALSAYYRVEIPEGFFKTGPRPGTVPQRKAEMEPPAPTTKRTRKPAITAHDYAF